MVKNYIMKNMNRALTLAQKTNHKFGQANGDLRSFAQSLVLSTILSTQQQLEDKENDLFKLSYNQIAETIGVHQTKYHKIRKDNQSKRDLLELQSESKDGVIPTGTIFL